MQLTFWNLRKYFWHGIISFLWFLGRHGEYLWTIGGEVTIKEDIHQVHLTNDVNQIEKLTENKLVHINIVSSDVSDDIVHYHVSSGGCHLSLSVQGLFTKILEQQTEFTTFPTFPNEVWYIT